MPKTTRKQVELRKIRSKIDRIRPLIVTKPGRRILHGLLRCKVDISAKRYYHRPDYGPTFHPTARKPPCHALFYRQSPAKHKHDFRLSQAEMRRLVDLYGGHEVFKSTGKKPQAKPLYQIGLLVHRLASGNDVMAVAKRFGVSGELKGWGRTSRSVLTKAGTVHSWTTRTCIALISTFNQVILWPQEVERKRLVARNFANTHIPHFLGVIDGTHINLDRAPGHKEDSGLFYSYKGRYGFNYVAIVDCFKRFTYLHYGFSSRSSDMRVQRAMRPFREPNDFFNDDEVILADAGFACTRHIIPMYKRPARTVTLPPRALWFNNTVKTHRVIVEHAFGILKGRWQLLRNGRLRLRTEQDEARAHAIIQCAFILHNLFVKSAEEYVSDEDLRELLREERVYRKWQIDRPDSYDRINQLHQRRERLVDEMLELEEEIEQDLLDMRRVRR